MHDPAAYVLTSDESALADADVRAMAHGRRRWFDALFLLGLAAVLLVNALIAFIDPDDFTRLVDDSRVARWLYLDGMDWLGPMIAIHDLALGGAVIAAIRIVRARRTVLAWTGAWLLAVTIIKLTALRATT